MAATTNRRRIAGAPPRAVSLKAKLSMSFELPASSFELPASSFQLRASSFQLTDRNQGFGARWLCPAAAPRLARGDLSLSKVAQLRVHAQQIPARRNIFEGNIAGIAICGPVA